MNKNEAIGLVINLYAQQQRRKRYFAVSAPPIRADARREQTYVRDGFKTTAKGFVLSCINQVV
jgi:hypothetical protein